MPLHFYDTIFNLRQHEEIVLYNKILQYSPEDETLVKDFLLIEYEAESQHYPFTAPPFNSAAALWAAKITCASCQLLLFRENDPAGLPQFLPGYEGVMDASAILSADLCLRFMPQALLQARRMDPDDQLVAVIAQHLQQWHYSGIGYAPCTITPDDEIFNNACLLQLYADRVVERQDEERAKQSPLKEKIAADMGLFAPVFWKTLNRGTGNEQH